MATTVLDEGDEECPGGGFRVDVGLDNGDGGGVAGDGMLDAGEIDDTEWVCNGAPDFTIHRGKIWSFSAEQFSYPVETVLSTASNPADLQTKLDMEGGNFAVSEEDEEKPEAPFEIEQDGRF